MPYRAELKRPDLKGQFPCSVCGKIFCHSSSLSRHRMQAHFKSYTCTQCDQEISSNETLRSHMFRMHSISRMFMCRCCNWAFPDKTSLHIHMQSMLRSGTPGDVAVLARSSTEDGPMEPQSECAVMSEQMKRQLMSSANANNNSITATNNNFCSIFPNVVKPDCMIPNLQKEVGVSNLEMNSLASNQWLSAWLANNPFASSLGLAGVNLGQTPAKSRTEDHEESHTDGMESDTLEIETTEEDLKEEERECNTPQSLLAKSESGDDEDKRDKGTHKRKTTRPQQMMDTDRKQDTAVLNIATYEKEGLTVDQLSPSVSDSHTSGTSCHPGESPRKCFDCQVSKSRLNVSTAKLREYEQKIQQLEARISDLQKIVNVESQEAINNGRRHAPTTSTVSPMPLFPMQPSLPFMQNPAMKMLFHNFMQATINRQPC